MTSMNIYGPPGDSDFAKLGDWEFDSPAAMRDAMEHGRTVSSNAALIVLHVAHDLEVSCLSTPVLSMGGNARARARRVSRPLRRAAWHLRAAQRCFAIVPRVFTATYEDQLKALQQNAHKGMDLKKS